MNSEFDTEIQETLKTLNEGGVILYPTDTVWGIGCDALNAKAVDRIYSIKNRAEVKSLIILVNSFEMLENYVDYVPEIAKDLINNIDNPVTVIYDQARNLPKNVYAKDGTIAIRIVRDEFCRQLIHELKGPLVSTSANISGQPTPMTFSKISNSIKQQVDYVVQLYHEKFNQTRPSTIIRLSGSGEYKIIRD